MRVSHHVKRSVCLLHSLLHSLFYALFYAFCSTILILLI